MGQEGGGGNVSTWKVWAGGECDSRTLNGQWHEIFLGHFTLIYDIVGRNCTEIAVIGQYAILLSLKNVTIIIYNIR